MSSQTLHLALQQFLQQNAIVFYWPDWNHDCQQSRSAQWFPVLHALEQTHPAEHAACCELQLHPVNTVTSSGTCSMLQASITPCGIKVGDVFYGPPIFIFYFTSPLANLYTDANVQFPSYRQHWVLLLLVYYRSIVILFIVSHMLN